MLTANGTAQGTGVDPSQNPLAQIEERYPGLLQEFGRLAEAMQRDVHVPPARTQSQLLPLLPDSTVFYLAIPNYGEASHQALTIFQARLKQSPVLREWWQQGEMAKNGPKIESSLEQFYQLSQFLGNEIVVSASTDNKQKPDFLLLAQVRKPGLRNFLQQSLKELAGEAATGVRVLDVQDLSAAKDGATDKMAILVRSDLVIAARDVAALRAFQARLAHPGRTLASTPFGQRLIQAYDAGTGIVAAGDLQTILSQVPSNSKPNDAAFQRSGFADMKYLVWEYRNIPGRPSNQAELSFTGPRHGIASWLAAPAPLGSLDFVSPKPVFAATILLKDPAQIFDELKEFTSATNPNAFAGLSQMEQAMKFSLRDDVLRSLSGEITLELDKVQPPDVVWKAILKIKDPERLQGTLSTLLAGTPVMPRELEQDGVTHHILRLPSRNKAMEIDYAFVDGYLIIASSPDALSESVAMHRGGESLARSSKFQASIPPGHSAEASAVFYQDALGMSALSLRRLMPQMADSFAQLSADLPPNVAWVYGEDSAIRQFGSGGGAGVTLPLIVGAIAIPNLLRARVSANEASAAANIRTVITAQVMYASTYPSRGYARHLTALGPDPAGTNSSTPRHAGFIDSALGNPSCVAGAWCEKSGFRFAMTGVCRMVTCSDFALVATPLSAGTGSRNYCATSDGVVRSQTGPPLASPVTVSECKSWAPLQ